MVTWFMHPSSRSKAEKKTFAKNELLRLKEKGLPPTILEEIFKIHLANYKAGHNSVIWNLALLGKPSREGTGSDVRFVVSKLSFVAAEELGARRRLSAFHLYPCLTNKQDFRLCEYVLLRSDGLRGSPARKEFVSKNDHSDTRLAWDARLEDSVGNLKRYTQYSSKRVPLLILAGAGKLTPDYVALMLRALTPTKVLCSEPKQFRELFSSSSWDGYLGQLDLTNVYHRLREVIYSGSLEEIYIPLDYQRSNTKSYPNLTWSNEPRLKLDTLTVFLTSPPTQSLNAQWR